MFQKLYYFDKTSNTPGDTLAAYGAARLFRQILEAGNYAGPKEIKLIDQGDKYLIQLPLP